MASRRRSERMHGQKLCPRAPVPPTQVSSHPRLKMGLSQVVNHRREYRARCAQWAAEAVAKVAAAAEPILPAASATHTRTRASLLMPQSPPTALAGSSHHCSHLRRTTRSLMQKIQRPRKKGSPSSVLHTTGHRAMRGRQWAHRDRRQQNSIQRHKAPGHEFDE